MEVAKRLKLGSELYFKSFLAAKDKKRLTTSKTKAKEETKAKTRKRRRIRKGLADKQKQQEKVVYEAGAFGDDAGPSKRFKTK